MNVEKKEHNKMSKIVYFSLWTIFATLPMMFPLYFMADYFNAEYTKNPVTFGELKNDTIQTLQECRETYVLKPLREQYGIN